MTDHPELSALGFLYERHGPAIARLGVACVGAGDAVRVTVAEVWAWQRDYEVRMPRGLLGGVSYAMGALDDGPRPEGLKAVPAAVIEGAAAFVEFLPMDEEPVHTWWLDPAGSPAVWCDDCGRRQATTRTRDRELGYWRERDQCGLCGLTDDAEPGVGGEWPDPEDVAAWERAPDADFLAFFAAYCVRYQERTGVPLPWHIASFVGRHPPPDE